jgi:GMP synthase-like glutamine amidotransferase
LQQRVLRAWCDPLPVTPGEVDLLLILGGPMGVGDLNDPACAHLAQELRLLQAALSTDTPVLGMCLGAQLLAHAAGGTVTPNLLGEPPQRIREIGWGALALYAEDPADAPLLEGLGHSIVVPHWHGDVIRHLPPGARNLASTLHCEHQWILVGRRAVGLQCHPEFGPEELARVEGADADYLRSALGDDGVRRLTADTRRHASAAGPSNERLLRNVLRHLLD